MDLKVNTKKIFCKTQRRLTLSILITAMLTFVGCSSESERKQDTDSPSTTGSLCLPPCSDGQICKPDGTCVDKNAQPDEPKKNAKPGDPCKAARDCKSESYGMDCMPENPVPNELQGFQGTMGKVCKIKEFCNCDPKMQKCNFETGLCEKRTDDSPDDNCETTCNVDEICRDKRCVNKEVLGNNNEGPAPTSCGNADNDQCQNNQIVEDGYVICGDSKCNMSTHVCENRECKSFVSCKGSPCVTLKTHKCTGKGSAAVCEQLNDCGDTTCKESEECLSVDSNNHGTCRSLADDASLKSRAIPIKLDKNNHFLTNINLGYEYNVGKVIKCESGCPTGEFRNIVYELVLNKKSTVVIHSPYFGEQPARQYRKMGESLWQKFSETGTTSTLELEAGTYYFVIQSSENVYGPKNKKHPYSVGSFEVEVKDAKGIISNKCTYGPLEEKCEPNNKQIVRCLNSFEGSKEVYKDEKTTCSFGCIDDSQSDHDVCNGNSCQNPIVIDVTQLDKSGVQFKDMKFVLAKNEKSVDIKAALFKGEAVAYPFRLNESFNRDDEKCTPKKKWEDHHKYEEGSFVVKFENVSENDTIGFLTQQVEHPENNETCDENKLSVRFHTTCGSTATCLTAQQIVSIPGDYFSYIYCEGTPEFNNAKWAHVVKYKAKSGEKTIYATGSFNKRGFIIRIFYKKGT